MRQIPGQYPDCFPFVFTQPPPKQLPTKHLSAETPMLAPRNLPKPPMVLNLPIQRRFLSEAGI